MTGAAVIGGVTPGDAGLVGESGAGGVTTGDAVVDGTGGGLVTTGNAVVVVACGVPTGGAGGAATVDDVAEAVLGGSDLIAEVLAVPVQAVSITAITKIPTRAENSLLTLICLP